MVYYVRNMKQILYIYIYIYIYNSQKKFKVSEFKHTLSRVQSVLISVP